MKILVLHAFSSKNLGDGLLVDETLELIREAHGSDNEVTVVAQYPESFSYHDDVKFVSSMPGKLGYESKYVKTLFNIQSFDLVVSVGGGYLRAGYPMELLKTAAIHGPQLLAASIRGNNTVYLPQSIGPIRFGLNKPISMLLKRIECVMLRDDRSMEEMALANPIRVPDLATGYSSSGNEVSLDVAEKPVLSVRAVRGKLAPGLQKLAAKLGAFDSYIQSFTGGNDDRPVTSQFEYDELLSREELMTDPVEARVVVAVRLHAALMALKAGHYVVHLAYERKGFGAFDDLGLREFVHNVNTFDVDLVKAQVQELLTSETARGSYRLRLEQSQKNRSAERAKIVKILKNSARNSI